jgi:D-cysteine desulfhydrase
VLVLGGEEPAALEGNVLLDHLCGARMCWTGPERRGERMEEVAEEARACGERPYVIPYGGSNAVGAVGYIIAMLELAEQLQALGIRADRVVFASSSGGTQAGLTVGARAAGFGGTLIGISVDKGDRSAVPYEEDLAELSNQSAFRAGLAGGFKPGDFSVNYDYLGGGYGVVGDAERESISLLARTEGLFLDPVYTGRAMAGLIDLIRRGELSGGETVVFLHTGGVPALFAYAEDLRPAGPAER